MTDTDDGGTYPDGWAKDEIARITAQMSEDAKVIKGEVLAAICSALTNHGLDGGLDKIPALGEVIWKSVCDKLIEKALHDLTGTGERQVRALSRTHGGSQSAHRFTWHYDRHKRRLSVSGRDYQRDLVTIGSLLAEGNIPRLDAIIYQSGTHAIVLRGRKLDRWINDTTRT
jgi:hypothetical protein